MQQPWPTEIRLAKDRRNLTVSFDDGRSYGLPAEYLRVFSPSAEVQGHAPEQRKVVGGKERVEIRRVEPVGNYAVKLHFDDGHDTGLFSWGYLHQLGEEYEARWQGYVRELAGHGLSRGGSS